MLAVLTPPDALFAWIWWVASVPGYGHEDRDKAEKPHDQCGAEVGGIK
jgi:hypothetical protein